MNGIRISDLSGLFHAEKNQLVLVCNLRPKRGGRLRGGIRVELFQKDRRLGSCGLFVDTADAPLELRWSVPAHGLKPWRRNKPCYCSLRFTYRRRDGAEEVVLEQRTGVSQYLPFSRGSRFWRETRAVAIGVDSGVLRSSVFRRRLPGILDALAKFGFNAIVIPAESGCERVLKEADIRGLNVILFLQRLAGAEQLERTALSARRHPSLAAWLTAPDMAVGRLKSLVGLLRRKDPFHNVIAATPVSEGSEEGLLKVNRLVPVSRYLAQRQTLRAQDRRSGKHLAVFVGLRPPERSKAGLPHSRRARGIVRAAGLELHASLADNYAKKLTWAIENIRAEGEPSALLLAVPAFAVRFPEVLEKILGCAGESLKAKDPVSLELPRAIVRQDEEIKVSVSRSATVSLLAGAKVLDRKMLHEAGAHILRGGDNIALPAPAQVKAVPKGRRKGAVRRLLRIPADAQRLAEACAYGFERLPDYLAGVEVIRRLDSARAGRKRVLFIRGEVLRLRPTPSRRRILRSYVEEGGHVIVLDADNIRAGWFPVRLRLAECPDSSCAADFHVEREGPVALPPCGRASRVFISPGAGGQSIKPLVLSAVPCVGGKGWGTARVGFSAVRIRSGKGRISVYSRPFGILALTELPV